MPTNVNIRYLDKVSLQKFYANSKNSIEDPIFTGFTLDIDTLHSPLFYALAGEEYSESLRSPDGTNAELSKQIEDKLKELYQIRITGTPDSYELNTLNAKEPISSNNQRKVGYGLQDKNYLDNVLYGAVDYIYMVDKVTEGAYTDEIGTYDVGNGTPNNSVYDKQNAVANNALVEQQLEEIMNGLEEQIGNSYIDEETGEWVEPELEFNVLTTGEALDKEINKKENGVTDEDTTEHQKNETALENAKKAYDDKEKEFKQAQEDFDKYNSDLGNQLNLIQNELNEYKEEMEKYEASLKNGVNKNEYATKIANVSLRYTNYIMYLKGGVDSSDANGTKYSEKYSKVTADISTPEDSVLEKELEKLSDQNKEYKETFKLAYRVLKTSITNPRCKDNKERKALQEKKNSLQTELYGAHSDTKLGTAGNPVGGLYVTYMEAKSKAENDAYSKKNREIETLKDSQANFENITKYLDIQSTKQTTQSNMPSMDNVDSASRYTRPMYEVPQTVYDMMGFINGMKKLTTQYPYVLQTVTGLDEAYKKYFDLKDPYLGSGDGKISISCLEFLDLRVSSMFNKYFNAVYDRQYRRERVPVNLRRFQCSIFVHDIRNFRNSMDGGIIPDDGDLSVIADIALNYVSAIEFKFFDCEIIPEETGGIFDNVTNLPNNDMRSTNFTFKYGNCIINFFPFADLKKYVLEKTQTDNDKDVQPPVVTEYIGGPGYSSSEAANQHNEIDDGNFRRWFDKSPLGNVDNNDYRDYIRKDTTVAVDDHYKTTIVNNFALNSVVDKNRELTEMDDALRRIVVGIAASTTTPTEKVADALNVKFIKPILTEEDKAAPVIKDLGNMNNSKVVDTHTMEYIGEVDEENKDPKIVNDLGNVNKQ